jgi:fructokinase
VTPAARPVLCAGEVLIDLIVSDGSTQLQEAATFEARPGGAPANAAVALSRLGVASAFCGVVGADPFGMKLRATLEVNGVDTSRLRETFDTDTTIAFAWKNPRGDGQFRLLRLADRLLLPEDIGAAGIDEIGALVIGSVALAAEPSSSAIMRAVEIAEAAEVPICFDVNIRPTMWPDLDGARAACEPLLARATLLKLSLDDARLLFGIDDAEAAWNRLHRYATPIIVLTDGVRGSWFAARSDTGVPSHQFIPAFLVDAIDPTGAGDAFTAAVISRLIAHNWQSLTADDMVFASAVGALTTTRRGAMEALPTSAEVDEFIATYPFADTSSN